MSEQFEQDDREALREAFGNYLGNEVYVCHRDWSAWGEGTMSLDDFSLAIEDDDLVESLVDVAVTHSARRSPAPQQVSTAYPCNMCDENESAGPCVWCDGTGLLGGLPQQVSTVGELDALAERCGNRLSVRIPDFPADQWDTSECIQEYGHAERWGTPCDDGHLTRWQLVSDE